MTSISLRLKRNAPQELPRDLILFKHWLALRSCTNYNNGMGIVLLSEFEKIKYMFRKKIKLFCKYYIQQMFLITEDGETYFWHDDKKENIENYYYFDYHYYYLDGSNYIELFNMYYFAHMLDLTNTCIKKCAVNIFNFLILTDDGKVYYNSNRRMTLGINEMVIERMTTSDDTRFTKITCFACCYNFHVLVTDNDRTYSWGINFDDHTDIHSTSYNQQLREVTELSGKKIVKVVCGHRHALVLTDKGEVYAWGSNGYKQSNIASEYIVLLFPTMVDIPNVKKISDIAAMKDMSIVKSDEDGLIYIWGCWAKVQINKNVICEYTNIFDICNTMVGQSPISMDHIYTDEDTNILNDLAGLFDDCSTSDLKIKIKEQSICVHKTILKIRSLYFRKMFKGNWIENNQCVIVSCSHYSYIVYETFLRYLYTGMINQLSMENLLELLKLADAYCEKNLERDCIWMIRKQITASNVLLVNNVAVQYDKKELEKYCLKFFMKNKTSVMEEMSFQILDSVTKDTLMTKVYNIYDSDISEGNFI